MILHSVMSICAVTPLGHLMLPTTALRTTHIGKWRHSVKSRHPGPTELSCGCKSLSPERLRSQPFHQLRTLANALHHDLRRLSHTPSSCSPKGKGDGRKRPPAPAGLHRQNSDSEARDVLYFCQRCHHTLTLLAT